MKARDYDVVVIGGGSAGLAAAVTAARRGARTLLLERHGFLGGMGTASLVHTFCGLYLLRDEPGSVLANPGFPSEMAERMMAATGLGPVRMGRVDVLPQHPVEFVRIADELVTAERDLELRLHAEVLAVERDEDGWRVEVGGRGGVERLRAKALVDASGDAVVADFLKVPAEMAERPRLQRPAYVFGVQGIDAAGEEMGLETAGWVVEGVRRGELPRAAMGIAFRSSGRTGEWFGTIDLIGAGASAEYDPFSAECLTGLEMEGRRVGGAVVRFLKAHSPGWKGAYVSQWPVRAGVRESRRWRGEVVLTGADLLAGRDFGEGGALATWPMEFRENTRGPKLRFPEENRPTRIPPACLKPCGIEALWVAGRCISVDHEAQASVRVMGTCFATGEMAGAAAAESAGA